MGNKTFKVHLDGFDLLLYLTGKVKKSPRKNIHYFSDDGDFTAIRMGDWKVSFMEQRSKGYGVWVDKFSKNRLPHVTTLRADPLERGLGESTLYFGLWSIWTALHVYKTQAEVAKFLATPRTSR